LANLESQLPWSPNCLLPTNLLQSLEGGGQQASNAPHLFGQAAIYNITTLFPFLLVATLHLPFLNDQPLKTFGNMGLETHCYKSNP
jgi:hypothetical protein